MNRMFLSMVVVVLVSGLPASPVGLKVNHLVSPGHVDGMPTFSWRMASDRPGARQTAYRLKIEGVWDSGVVEDGKSVGVAYAGKPLESSRRYLWTVAVRDETGAWSESESAAFSTGILNDGDWGGAQWIAPDTPAPHGYKTALFRRGVASGKPVAEAWLTVAGAGVFVATVNGRPMTDDFLLPGATHAQRTRQACTYEVTRLLDRQVGSSNVVDVTVSTGWSRDRIAARNVAGRTLDPARPGTVRACLLLRFADGSEDRIVTDGSWLAAEGGPLVAAGIYEGEEFDARGGDPLEWKPAVPNVDFAGVVRNFRGPPVTLRRDLTLTPQSVLVVCGAEGASAESFGTAKVVRRFADGEPMTLRPGEQLVIDFGQNASAVPDFVFEAARGTKVTVRHAEMLNEGGGLKSRGNDGPDGTPYLANLRTSFAGIRYTCRGGERESYRPSFTFFGCRYIGVTADGPLTVWRVTSVPVTSVSQGSDTGTLETDNPRVNRLLANCRWGMYSNYLSVPTDCPQRDERVGWTADTQVFAPAAAYLADVYSFLSKWMGDMRDSQRADGCFSQIAPENAVRGAVTGWTDAGVIVPYVLWRRFGDATVVRENWSAMVRYLDYVEKRGAQDAQPYGDWLSYEYGADMEWLKPVREQRQLPRKRVLNAAYRVWIGRMMAEMADELGDMAAAAKYRAFAERETERFRETCLKPDGTLLAECDGQCSELFALYLKLLPNAAAVEATKRDLRENFRRNGNCLRTGFLGTAILLDAVTEGLGDVELAYTLLLQDRNPSWLYSVDQGATTIWERWNSYTKAEGFGPVSMNSFNHYAYGAVANWMFSTMAGIRAEEPGFRKIRFAPKPDGRIGRVSASFDSPYGRIHSSWRLEGSRAVWEGEVPPNATAVLELPDGSVRSLESGRHRADWSVRPAARDFVECVFHRKRVVD